MARSGNEFGPPYDNGTPVGQLERLARVVAQVGFPIVVAGVLLYAILWQFIPELEAQSRATGDLSANIKEQTAVLHDIRESTKREHAEILQHELGRR